MTFDELLAVATLLSACMSILATGIASWAIVRQSRELEKLTHIRDHTGALADRAPFMGED